MVSGVKGMVEELVGLATATPVFFDYDNVLVKGGEVHSSALGAWISCHASASWIFTARCSKDKLEGLVADLRSMGLLESFCDQGVVPARVELVVCASGVRVQGTRIIGSGAFNKGEVMAAFLSGDGSACRAKGCVFFDDNPYNAHEVQQVEGVTAYWVDLCVMNLSPFSK